MALDETTVTVIIAIVVIIAVTVSASIIFAMRRKMQKPAKPSKQPSEIAPELSGLPFKVTKSVQSNDATQAKDELRILDLEREILGDAIRHLYEAHAEGKITEQEREKLASSYKSRMMAVKESMAKDETIVALHELEGMQEDLMKMFSERFGELTGKVEELRSRIDVKPIREIKVQMPKQQTPVMPDQLEQTEEEEEEAEEGEEKAKKKRKPPEERKTQKTEAEERIDAIRSEVEKVLDKLGQMEMEA